MLSSVTWKRIIHILPHQITTAHSSSMFTVIVLCTNIREVIPPQSNLPPTSCPTQILDLRFICSPPSFEIHGSILAIHVGRVTPPALDTIKIIRTHNLHHHHQTASKKNAATSSRSAASATDLNIDMLVSFSVFSILSDSIIQNKSPKQYVLL